MTNGTQCAIIIMSKGTRNKYIKEVITMYNVMIINNNKARLHTKTNSIVKATQTQRELQAQGQRVYLIKREDKR